MLGYNRSSQQGRARMEPGSSPAASESRPGPGGWRQGVRVSTLHWSPVVSTRGLSVTWANETRDRGPYPRSQGSSRHICLPVIPAGCSSSWSLSPLVYVSQVSHLLLHIPRVPWPSAWTHLPLWRPAHIIADLNLDVHWALQGVKFVILYSSLFASVFCYHKQQSVDCLM